MKKYILFIFLFTSLLSFAQQKEHIVIEWKPAAGIQYETVNYKVPQFAAENFEFNADLKSIRFKKAIPINGAVDTRSLKISNVVYESISRSDLNDLSVASLPDKLNEKLEHFIARDEQKAVLIFSPIIKVGETFKRVVSLDAEFSNGASLRIASQNMNVAAVTNSVLASGDFYRFYVEKSGVYKISRAFLQQLGMNTGVDPRNIKIYGNGGRMLPLLNSTPYPDDLEENAIQVIGEGDGDFGEYDYIIFYAEGPEGWNKESLTNVNLYADRSHYYITTKGGPGKRINTNVQPTAATTVTYNQFDDYQFHEVDKVNIGRLGRKWFGEMFAIENEQTFKFQIPNIVTSVPVKIRVNMASASYGNSSFQVKANEQSIGTANFNALSPDVHVAAYETLLENTFSATTGDISVKLTYDNGGVPSSNGYLDYIALESQRQLSGYGKQFLFYRNDAANNIGVAEYIVSNASGVGQVWDVTDIYNVTKFENQGQATFSFKANLGEVRKYVAVDYNDLYSPLNDGAGRIANQDLKGTIFKNQQGEFQDVDYLIITPASLNGQAERLANYHRNNSGLNVKVVNLENIYQEFSSGKQDIAAIRNFIKYVYWNASTPTKRVRYVNMFGDASFDYKNRIPNNTNIVPVFHGLNPSDPKVNNSQNFSAYASFMSDDFYVLMDPTEGPMLTTDGLDIAVGRMLVSSGQQASDMVGKALEYFDERSYGRWRNNYVLISDDADNTTDAGLQFDLNALGDELYKEKPFVNVKKIHTDSYLQEVAAGGERYPKARLDILEAFAQGALAVNYFGHGGEDGLATERIFDKADAQNLTNRFRYPLFITITCEFTRFDNPYRPTGGEYMYWNTAGGAVALVATTREIGITTGLNMNKSLSKFLYSYGSEVYDTMSEALRRTKNENLTDNRNVVFFIGDPAMKLAIPKPKIRLTKVNDVPIAGFNNALQALSYVKLAGEVTDEIGNPLPSYNGDLAVQIFDKKISRSTLGNNGASNSSGLIIMNFKTLGETVFRGNASVTNGTFEFGFVMPKDIRVPVGNGRVSFYAKRKQILENQTGYDTLIQIGGVNPNAAVDNTPPKVRLYMNDESFVSGGITNASPYLLAFLEDENGINTASGIGHDIIGILDGDETKPYVMNDYYETFPDDYTKGKLRFPFRNLAKGLHTLTFKAWDVYNNLVTAEIQFVVVGDEGLELDKVLNYPNPFVSYTEFWFTHNSPYEPLDVQVQIMTITGKVVKTINQSIMTEGFLSRDIKWDGRDDFGDRIGKGVYVYKLTVKSSVSNKRAEKYEKLVIL
ncbi:type IX secretion system sortase PorU [Flavobacterium sp.]|uniref:type IX secretion system sortase PorU n=1 Tax=Flavobacterium sp. TaxID=239 RepID=UPI002612448F|nr:type IX secretion system sortase PorU [Flavobacterium sp.]